MFYIIRKKPRREIATLEEALFVASAENRWNPAKQYIIVEAVDPIVFKDFLLEEKK